MTGTRNAGFFGTIHWVGGQPAGGDHEMDVRMIEQRPRPGVEDRDATRRHADIARVGGEGLERRRRTPHQRAIDDALMAERAGAQLLRERDGDQIVEPRQQPRAVSIEPPRGLVPATLGAMAVATRVIAIDGLPTRGALGDLPATGGRPARRQIAQGPPLTGQQSIAGVRAQRRPVEADDLRHLQHDAL